MATTPNTTSLTWARKYQQATTADGTPAGRNMAVATLVEVATILTGTDTDLAAAVRAIIAADQAGTALDAPQAVDADVEWCRLCDEQPAPGIDGLCGHCRVNVTEGRVIDPDADTGAGDGAP